MEKTFSKIYDKNIWGNGSGLGSTLNYNKAYIDFLTEFMNELNIKKVLDIGCGDWQFSQYIDWSNKHYMGIDCVQSVIHNNNLKFKKNNIEFHQIDPTISEDFDLIPKKCDLVILKDILQHWDNNNIVKFMDKLTNEGGHKLILVVNNFKNADGVGRSINNRYHYAKLDASQFPLNKYSPQILGYYKFKQVAIIDTNRLENVIQNGSNKKSRKSLKKNKKYSRNNY